MKTLKRILYVLLVFLAVLVIGYLIFTSSRLSELTTENEINILLVSNVLGDTI